MISCCVERRYASIKDDLSARACRRHIRAGVLSLVPSPISAQVPYVALDLKGEYLILSSNTFTTEISS
jgi:hypothetical protein